VEWGDTVKFFAALFAIMNPIGNMPIFLSVTDGKSNAERAKVAAVSSAAVAVILVVCALIGAQLLQALGISVAGLRTAGGLIILSIAYSLLHAKPSGMHQSSGDTDAQGSPAIYPLHAGRSWRYLDGYPVCTWRRGSTGLCVAGWSDRGHGGTSVPRHAHGGHGIQAAG